MNTLRIVRSIVGLAAGAGLVAVLTGTAFASNSVSGEAFGVSAGALLNGAVVTVGPTPHVVLCPDGGMEADTLVKLSVPNLVTSATLAVRTAGSIGPSAASAESSATVEQVNVLNNLVSATLVVAMASSRGDGVSATSSGEGSTLIGLSINGGQPVDVTPTPNTKVAVPGGTVTLNEQISSGDGVHTSALTVNMIHVVLSDPVTGTVTADIIVASAHSDVNFAPAAKTGNAFMTGGGKLGTGRDIATFGLNAGSRGGGGLHGQLEYNDHGQGVKVHGHGLDSFSLMSGTPCVTFSGPASVNNVDGYEFTVNMACDYGEPGVGTDYLDISVSGPNGFSYARKGTLTGGNLQLHPE